ncbi:bifunctional transcriptional activator/DNA repair enzyme AdaA [Bacillus atrophaeus]|jgi:AraC family transcriptional regulator of adaptative response / methylphosphotriester-DNA alkyltransferase methyltransferase|uniref:bifunctional transcriptional activator/DNA repair enzyme AdaA n=1 Tax=Bacillus atrophaeus TaxID=1452 RepID=UPI002282E592|nr:bifunctional transcriptional activator/DNA repair enzyme AdaA [Bacillus atrophaeus]MCY9136406.1 bifunctional transcriptional activator/DNA repair enzyme AdaA [Bacillus atrophaeus]MCY9166224.1 bifunctional transcriptional activator/DNA repair enzyme AdaA [Bacillus atrophaeus]
MAEKKNLPDEKWNAIVNNDSSYDGEFYYAVKTTGIFCRPSCKSRVPNKENVRIFQTAEQALGENFRPCKRCKPNGLRLPDEDWVTQIKEFIDCSYSESLTLDKLADMCHGSPYHLQRTFKKAEGITPLEYIQKKRIAAAAQYLELTDQSIRKIGLAVGIPNTAHFATLFKKRTGYTPTKYRQIKRENS